MLPIESAFKVFTDRNGKPLENGFVSFGVPNLNPITSPTPVYWDAAGTQPAKQPLRTVNGYIVRGGTPANVFIDVTYSQLVQDSKGRQVFYARNSEDFSLAAKITSFLSGIASGTGSTLVGFLQSGVGAIIRSIQEKLRDTVSVKDYGAIGTNFAGNVTADTAAFMAALATGKNVFVPQGTYYVSSTMNLGAGQAFKGAGRGKTLINYTGSGDGIFAGSTAPVSLIYDIEMSDFTLACINKITPVDNGIRMENCVYFSLDRISIFGSRSPNVPEPLVGNGLYLTNNSILGRINNVSCRQWEKGYYFRTLPASPSFWTAAITVGGQGELANVMFGIVVGDTTNGNATGVGMSIRDMSFQGCYSGAILINGGNSTLVDTCYFEGNGNYDVTVGTTGGGYPISCKIVNCNMASENLSGSPYGAAPYTAKIIVVNGSFTTIRDNNISISTAIPLIRVGAAAEATAITGNRLNSTISAASRITNNSTSTTIFQNNPNQNSAGSFAGSFTKILSDPSTSTAYTGVGFQPSAVEFYCAVDTTTEFCVGMSDGTRGRSVTSDGAGAKSSSPFAIKLIRSTSADFLTGNVVSFDADGFTINWAKTGSPPANSMVVNYIAHR